MSGRNALVVLLGLTGTLSTQVTTSVDERADAYIRSAGIQGSVLLAKGGNIILARGYGLANIELGVANKPETKFRLGSITKQFTATAILQLQEQGKLTVTDPISKYIPDSPAAWSNITVHHLLTHTSGIPSYTDTSGYPEHMRERAGTPLEFINHFRNLPLDFRPVRSSTTTTRGISSSA